MLEIIQVTPAYKPAYIYGGPTMSVAKLCEALVDNGQEVKVLTTTANGETELPVICGAQVAVDNVPVIYFKRLTKDHTHFSPDLLTALRKIMLSTNTKGNLIIHIHSWWNLVAILSCLIAKIYQVPVVLSPRGMLTSYTQTNRNSFLKSALHRLIGRALLKSCNIIASSAREEKDILQITHPKSLYVIPNLVNLPYFAAPSGYLPSKSFRLLFLSRIEEKKGLDLLLNCLADFTVDWKLTIAGSGDDFYIEHLKSEAKKLKIASKITWSGQVDNKYKFELMSRHDMVMLTSYNENFANVVVESLSVGTPVFLSDQVGLSDYVLLKDLGFVSSLKQNEITDKLYEAHLDLAKRNRIRLEAPGIIKFDFAEEKLIEKYVETYREILAHNG